MAKSKKPRLQEKQLVKKTQTDMADAVIEELLGIVPGGAIPYRIMKASFRHRQTSRLNTFHRELLEGIPKNFRDKFKEEIKPKFTVDDYYSFLNYAVQDEEEIKVKLYARIFQGFLTQLVPKNTKVHLLKSSRELRVNEFEIMRQLYIANKYEFMGSQGKESQIKAITETKDPLETAAVQTFNRLGFLTAYEDSPRPTSLLSLFIELSYDSTELTPESIGRQRKTVASINLGVWFLCNDLGNDDYVKILLRLTEALHMQNISSQTINPLRAFDNPFARPEILVLCAGSKGTPIENTKQFIGLDNKYIIEVLLPGSKRPMLPFTDVPIFDFTTDVDHGELTRFVNTVTSEIKNRGLDRFVR